MLLRNLKKVHTGRNFTVDKPKFEFKAPVFTKREKSEELNIPKASSNPDANEYLG
jgi:hypothetical protein